MTEKVVKKMKNKNKATKLKAPAAKPKPVPANEDSDFSDSEAPGNGPKLNKKAINEISSEVNTLLASLKKEHGLENDDEPAPKQKVNEKTAKKAAQPKKEAKNVDKAKPVQAKPAKVEQKQAKKTVDQKVNNKVDNAKKQKGAVANAPAAQKKIKVEPKENPAKKQQKKRAAQPDNADNEEEATEQPPAKKGKANQQQKQKPKKEAAVKKEVAVKKKPAVKKEPAIKKEPVVKKEPSDESQAKKEHHLKNATPVYVGNLPVSVKRIKLVKLFKKYGKIMSIRMRTNSGKNFFKKGNLKKVPFLVAFIYFGTREEAEASLAANGQKVGDNEITVDLDLGVNKPPNDPHKTVMVGNLKYAVTTPILREAFKCCGEIEHIHTVQTALGCSGIAFIRFAKPESCALALELNGTSILDREIRVEKYKEGKSKENKQVKKEKTPKPITKKAAQNQKNAAKKPNSNKDEDSKKKKKNKEFLGTKSTDKKKVNKKKNKLSNEKRLALKVAPKAAKSSD